MISKIVQRWVILALLCIFMIFMLGADRSRVIFENQCVHLTDGTNLAVIDSAGSLQTTATPYLFSIARDNISGVSFIDKFGHNAAASGTEEEVWEGSAPYVYLTSAEQVKLSSNDVDDDSSLLSSGAATEGSSTTLVDSGATFQSDGVAAGDIILNDSDVAHAYVTTVDSETQIAFMAHNSTDFVSGDAYRVVNANDSGAAVVEIRGLAGDLAPLSEFMLLSTGASTTAAGSYLRVFRAIVRLAGSSNGNEGTLSLKNNAENNTLAVITAGRNQTLMAMWTVPAGKTFYLLCYYASEAKGKETELLLRWRDNPNEPFGLKHHQFFKNAAIKHIFQIPLELQAGSDIAISTEAGGGGGKISAGFAGWYE